MYAAQRARHENAIARTLEAIDVATGVTPSCMTCFQPIPGDWLSDIFCSTRCQHHGLIANTPGESERTQGVDGPQLDISHAWSGYRRERESEQRGLNVMRPVPIQLLPDSPGPPIIPSVERLESYPRSWYVMSSFDSYVLDDERLQHLIASVRSIADSLTVAFRPMIEAFSNISRDIGSLGDVLNVGDDVDSAEFMRFNKHVKLPPGDPRREILSKVQERRRRGSGPQRTPFTRRQRGSW